MTEMKRYSVGIDLGTSNTVLAYAEAGSQEVRVFEIEQLVSPGEVAARPLLPSVRYHAARGELAAGDLQLPWSGSRVAARPAAQARGASAAGVSMAGVSANRNADQQADPHASERAVPAAGSGSGAGSGAGSDTGLRAAPADGDSDTLPVVIGRLARVLGAQVPGRLVTSAKSWLSHASVDRVAPILPWGAADDVLKVFPLEATASYLPHVRAP